MVQFSLPKLTAENGAEQNRQIRTYLYQLTEQLQFVLSNLDTENFSEEIREQYEGSKSLPERVATLTAATDANSARTEALSGTLAETGDSLREQYRALSDAMETKAEEIENAYRSEIETAADEITTTVENKYTLKTETEALSGVVASNLQQTAEALLAVFTENYEYTEGDSLNAFSEQFRTYLRFSADGIEIGKSDSQIIARLTNDKLSFVQPGNVDYEVAYISDKKLYITEAQVLKRITFGADAHGQLFDLKSDPETGLTLTVRAAAQQQ